MKTIYWCEELELFLVEEEDVRGTRAFSGQRTKDWENIEMDVVRIGYSYYDRISTVKTVGGLHVEILKCIN